MLDAGATFGANDTEDAHPGIRMIGSVLCKHQFCRIAELEAGSAHVCEFAFVQILDVRERR